MSSLRLSSGSNWFDVCKGSCWSCLLTFCGLLFRFDEFCHPPSCGHALVCVSSIRSPFVISHATRGVDLPTCASSCSTRIISLYDFNSDFSSSSYDLIILQHSHILSFTTTLLYETGAVCSTHILPSSILDSGVLQATIRGRMTSRLLKISFPGLLKRLVQSTKRTSCQRL
jgi:hypothetical protein